MKVALISHEFPPFIFGGIGSHCYNLACSLSKKGINTTVFTGKSKKITIEKLNNTLHVIRLPYFNFPPRVLWFQLQNYKVLSKLLYDYDIIHIVDPTSGAICARINKKLKKPLITTIHSIPSKCELRNIVKSSEADLSLGDLAFHVLEYPIMEFTSRYCLKNSNHLIFCGLYALEMTRAYLGIDIQKTSVIYNGIRFDETKNNFSFTDTNDKNVSKIIFLGRLYSIKGITYLIRALALLKKDLPHFSLEIFGSGPLERKIKKLASNLELEDKVHVRGFINNHWKLLKAIEKADVVALPSLLEVGPFISALECMACKKPIVAFDLPFMREFITDMQNGLLAKPYDEKDLAEKLYLLLTNPELCTKLGNNAYKYVKEEHNWDILVERYTKIYEKIL